jgi:hypothetical protein
MADAFNWADLLDKELAFVVLTKANRLQVLLHPTTKQLRRRGKANWTVVAARTVGEGGAEQTNGHPVVPAELREAVLHALRELASSIKHADSEESRAKSRRKKEK